MTAGVLLIERAQQKNSSLREALKSWRRRAAGLRGRIVDSRRLRARAHFALDNRCPHMGFPLERGSIEDGIFTCHWHHARFDLESGCTFDYGPTMLDVPHRSAR